MNWAAPVKYVLIVFLTLGPFQCGFFDAIVGAENDETKEVLNLAEIEALALKRCSDLAKARLLIEAAEQDLAKSQAAFFPQVDLLMLTGPASDAEKPFVQDGEIVSRTSRTDYSSINVFARIELAVTQPLYTFGKLSNSRKAAEQSVRAEELHLEQLRREILRDVRIRYYGLALALMGQAAVEEGDRYLRDLREKVDRLIELGAANVELTDRYRVESQWGALEQSKARVRSARNKAHRALKSLMEYPDDQDFEIEDRQLPDLETDLKQESFYSETAVVSRPEILRLEKAILAKEYQYEALQSDRYPDFFAALRGAVARAPGRERFNDAYISDEFNEEYIGLVLGGEWHLDFGLSQADIDRAKIEQLALERERDVAENGVALQAANYYQDVIRARDAASAYQRSARVSRKWVVTAIADFDMGVGDLRDALEALDQYGKNRGDYLLNLYDFHVAKVNLLYASGILEADQDSASIGRGKPIELNGN
ncbi:MAG: TolC family protein [Deltaproteobacteria bacterium]|nr:TolC family protein [Deltaproteobacteria bacterium]